VEGSDQRSRITPERRSLYGDQWADRRPLFLDRATHRSTLRLDTDSVVDRRPDSLLAAQVSLGGLDRDVTGEKLDLFQVAAGGMTQPCACSPQVTRRKTLPEESPAATARAFLDACFLAIV
jgi:hypothetical protein